ncbi:MAG: S41 family peptidase [Dehalococcoidales bacterium]|nr:S41 family peptidase [Dehalococcoidales bacterium]
MSRKKNLALLAAVSILVVALVFSAGCIITLRTASSPDSKPDSNLIQEAWDKIHIHYVEPDELDSTVLNQGAVRGMVQSLEDPYSYYLTPDEYEMTQGDFQSSFGGIGASISMNKDGYIVVVEPMEDSPAIKAGIRANDIILAVDDTPTEGLTVQETVSIVRGPVGTRVRLRILHEGENYPVDIEITRGEINPATVYYRMEGDIAYIRITNFYERTGDEFQEALEALDLENSRGIILDLRNNLGGLVSSMVEVASHFIKEGVIISFRDNQGNMSSQSAKPSGVFTELPVVVLVNEFSASASEVLSGAMQDYERGAIAGTRTLGKGSYDSFYPLSDGSAIYLTVGRWLTPAGREIEGEGITPDYELTQTGEEAIQWAIDFLHSGLK